VWVLRFVLTLAERRLPRRHLVGVLSLPDLMQLDAMHTVRSAVPGSRPKAVTQRKMAGGPGRAAALSSVRDDAARAPSKPFAVLRRKQFVSSLSAEFPLVRGCSHVCVCRVCRVEVCEMQR
jgi:hypothetical protein